MKNGVIVWLPAAVFLFGVMISGCERDERITPLPGEESNATQNGMANPAAQLPSLVAEGHLRLDDPNSPPVLAQMNLDEIEMSMANLRMVIPDHNLLEKVVDPSLKLTTYGYERET